MSQAKQILRHIIMHKSITPLEALREYGCLRLAARIFDLNASGANIKMKMVFANKKKFAQYYIN